jgi:hypothetical protein
MSINQFTRWNKAAPLFDQTKRNQRLFEEFMNGSSINELTIKYRLVNSRCRKIIQELCLNLHKEAMREDTSLKSKFEFKTADMYPLKDVWLLRLEKHLDRSAVS